MAAIHAKHKLTVTENGTSYIFFFLAPPTMYDGIASFTGIEKLADDSDEQDMPLTKTSELTLSPVASRKTLRIKMPNNTLKYSDIVVAATTVATLDESLNGKSYKGGTITRVLDSRKKSKF